MLKRKKKKEKKRGANLSIIPLCIINFRHIHFTYSCDQLSIEGLMDKLLHMGHSSWICIYIYV
jgi:hypothetical protein